MEANGKAPSKPGGGLQKRESMGGFGSAASRARQSQMSRTRLDIVYGLTDIDKGKHCFSVCAIKTRLEAEQIEFGADMYDAKHSTYQLIEVLSEARIKLLFGDKFVRLIPEKPRDPKEVQDVPVELKSKIMRHFGFSVYSPDAVGNSIALAGAGSEPLVDANPAIERVDVYWACVNNTMGAKRFGGVVIKTRQTEALNYIDDVYKPTDPTDYEVLWEMDEADVAKTFPNQRIPNHVGWVRGILQSEILERWTKLKPPKPDPSKCGTKGKTPAQYVDEVYGPLDAEDIVRGPPRVECTDVIDDYGFEIEDEEESVLQKEEESII